MNLELTDPEVLMLIRVLTKQQTNIRQQAVKTEINGVLWNRLVQEAALIEQVLDNLVPHANSLITAEIQET